MWQGAFEAPGIPPSPRALLSLTPPLGLHPCGAQEAMASTGVVRKPGADAEIGLALVPP